MTREEANKYAESKKMMLEALIYNDDCKYGNYAMCSTELSFVNAALSALCPVSREQVEKVWRGKWIGMTDDDGCTWYECSRCEHDLDSLEEPNHFCPACGAPMTDEAVDMMMERLEALKDG